MKHVAVSTAAGLALLLSGCANPGPPRPPSLHLPQIVKDLQAERSGDHVLLHWTTPSRTTDDMEIRGAMTAEVCREVGARPLTPAARAAACAPVRRLPVTSGASEVLDTLPPALQGDPVMLLTYRVQIYNSTGHSAGNSTGAYAASGSVPHAVESLRATASESGAVIEWRSAWTTGESAADFVDLTRMDLSPQRSAAPAGKKEKTLGIHLPGKPRAAKNPKPEAEENREVHLRTPESQAGAQLGVQAGTQAGSGKDTTGTVDATAVVGDTYMYQAERVRAVTAGSHALEIRSEPSAAVTLVMADTFPPKVPTGLAAISGMAKPYADPANAGKASSGPETAPYIDLSWEPNTETDLAGYRVYRQLARPDGSPRGPLARLNAVPIPAPAYRDVAVRPGQGYIYSVTAVDVAGNESAPSAKALEVISPEGGEPSSP